MAYRATLTAAEAAHADLIRLWHDNLISVGDAEAKFRWFYLDAPAGPASAFLLRPDDGPDADKAIGCAGIGVRELSAFGKSPPLSAALLADLAVDKRHRTALPAITMQRGVRRHCQATFDLAYGFPNELAVAVHLRLGFKLLGHLGRWVKVLRHSHYLGRVLPQPLRLDLITRASGGVVDRAIAARSLPSRLTALRKYRLDLLTTADAIDWRFDELWARSRLRYPICTVRSAAFLRWRYLRQPGGRCRIAALVSRNDRRIVAYAAVQANGSMATMLDMFGETDDSVDALLSLLTPALRVDGFASVAFGYLGNASMKRLLTAQGFGLRAEAHAVIVDPGTRLPFEAARLYDANNWYLTAGDEDT